MSKKKILVVDDEVIFTRIVSKKLESTGKYEVKEENSGTRAYATAKEFQPDMILLDVIMPDIDGGAVAEQIQDDENLKHIPIVFLTAMIQKEDVGDAGGDIGGRTFLAKPVESDSLIKCIEKELGR